MRPVASTVGEPHFVTKPRCTHMDPRLPADLNLEDVCESDDENAKYCPVFQHVIELLGRRWTGVIVRELLRGPARFTDLRRAIPGLSDRLLVERLQELEHEGIITRKVAEETPIYELTERGEDLRTTISSIGNHAGRWAPTCELAARPGRRS